MEGVLARFLLDKPGGELLSATADTSHLPLSLAIAPVETEEVAALEGKPHQEQGVPSLPATVADEEIEELESAED